jgi:hypothetical protein
MTESEIKALTEGEPERVRSDMGTVATPEERHDYPELGLRRYDGCDLVMLSIHPSARDEVRQKLWLASAGDTVVDPHSFVGAVHRLCVDQLVERAWTQLVRGGSPEEKLLAQRRVDYLNRVLGRIDAQKGNRYTDPRVVQNRRRLIERSAELRHADALDLWR